MSGRMLALTAVCALVACALPLFSPSPCCVMYASDCATHMLKAQHADAANHVMASVVDALPAPDPRVCQAEILLERRGNECERLRMWLRAPAADPQEEDKDEDSVDPDVADVLRRRKPIDRRCNLKDFSCQSTRRPHNFERAIRIAGWVHIDEMRTLLELHYDDVHLREYKKKNTRASAKHVLYRSVAAIHRNKLNIQLALPPSIAAILKKPEDEDDWHKLSSLRREILRIVEGETEISLTPAESLVLSKAIREHTSMKHPNEVGPGSKLPPGCRVLVDCADHRHGGNAVKVQRIRKRVANAVHGLDMVRVLTKPAGSALAAPLSNFAKLMFKHDDIHALAAAASEGPCDKHEKLNQAQILDQMLLVLWDALFLQKAEQWTTNSVANLPAEETYDLARWFLRGQVDGAKPLFDGICSQCGALLYGVIAQSSALSNKFTGPPTDRDGTTLIDDDGKPITDAQPPFLLRFSPGMFAKEVPEIFKHNPATNRLSLREGVQKPWLRPQHSRCVDDVSTWLYCTDCKDRYCKDPARRPHSHVPYRDMASRSRLKPVKRNAPMDSARENPGLNQNANPERVTSVRGQAENNVAQEDEDSECEVGMLGEGPEPAKRPDVDEYKQKWAELRDHHERSVPGPFNERNLVPKPDHRLWQDCPHVPFDALKSDEAQARLSVCRPLSGLQEAQGVDGRMHYAHNHGEVNYRRRAPRQLASTLGFILNKNDGKFMKVGQRKLVSDEELAAVHECLNWGRSEGNNKIFEFFGTVYESFSIACGTLMKKFEAILPTGCNRARIRMTNRVSRQPQEMELGSTVGQESRGLVVVDMGGHPMKYDALSVFEDAVALQSCRIALDVPGADGKGWQRSGYHINAQEDLGNQVCQDLASGARHLLQETWVPANDPHYDAKCWPCVHPYGTGSLLSEVGSGGLQRHARNRLTSIQSWFRQNALWGFWMYDRLIKEALFFKHKRRKSQGKGPELGQEDPYKRYFGTVQPADIPETGAWWKRQSRDLMAMSDDAELGVMQAMVTITQNDSCPEMLAVVRRGPFAVPTDEERIEYLLRRKRKGQIRPDFEKHSFEHVLSFQRRVHAIKIDFMKRTEKTPLGRVKEWWDRTEAQMRAALHSHILVWFQARELPSKYKPLDPISRTAAGSAQKQRPASQSVEAVTPYQEDDLYYKYYAGRVMAEMVRPDVSGADWGGYSCETLRIAGLARSMQTKLYLHSCTHVYCKKDSNVCRFFFPWPQQPQQQYDLNTERVALQRRLPEDDQWVVPHNLALAMYSPSTVNVLPFDPRHGADQARQYATKYACKQEPWYYLATEKNGVKDFLKCRNTGLCMAHNRLLNFHLVRSTQPVQFTPGDFIPSKDSRTTREDSHKQKYPDYPDEQFYLGFTQKFFFRHPNLRHLRVEQCNRYFVLAGDGDPDADPTIEDTIMEEDAIDRSDPNHRHFDEISEAIPAGARFPSWAKGLPTLRRRGQGRLGISRVPFKEPIGAQRESFYEQRLALSLAWYCSELPKASADGSTWTFKWDPPADIGDAALPAMVLTIAPGTPVSFEQLCSDLEKQFNEDAHGLTCACCLGELGHVCKSCTHAVGFHYCMKSPSDKRHLLWRKGTLHAGALDVERTLFNLHRKGLTTASLREKADEYVDAGLLSSQKAERIIRIIEEERQIHRVVNDTAITEETTAEVESSTGAHKKTKAQLAGELAAREANMRKRSGVEGVRNDLNEGETDQWRVYQFIIRSLEANKPLRLMVQASAGTGSRPRRRFRVCVCVHVCVCAR